MNCTHQHLTVHHSYENRSSTAECGVCGRKGLPYLWTDSDKDKSDDYLGYAFEQAIELFRGENNQ